MQPFYDSGGVRLFQGDCLEVMRCLPDNSVDACITLNPNVQTVPLDPLMARMAKRDYVVECVSVVWVGKAAHGRNVMNVVLTIFRGATTTAAGIVIARSRSATQWLPVGAVVAGMPAAPLWIRRPAVALVSTRLGAKTIDPRALHRCGQADGLSTGLALEQDAGLNGRARNKDAAFAKFKVTGVGADNEALSPVLERLALKSRLASLTGKNKRALLIERSKRIGAGAATRCLPSMLESNGIGLICNLTDRASSCNH